jgi:hypothetical protein
MSKVVLVGALCVGLMFAASSCEDNATSELEIRMSALGGFNGSTVASPVRAYIRPDGVYQGVFRSQAGNVVQVTGNPFNASRNMASNEVMGSTPWGFALPGGMRAVAYVSSDQHVHVVRQVANGGSSGTEPSHFVDQDLALSPPSAPLAKSAAVGPVPDVIGYTRSDGKGALVYRTANDHVEEVLFPLIGSTATDLTVASGALVNATSGSAFPYARSDGYNTVVYVGSDNQIHELATAGGGSGTGSWSDASLSVASGDPATPSTDPWGYRRGDDINAVIFVATDGLLHELSLSGFSWGWGTLPAVSPTGGLAARPSGYIRPDGFPGAVVYRSTTGEVHEISLGAGVWVDAVVPVPAGISPTEQMFAHQGPGAKSSILFSGMQSGGMHGYRMSRNSGSGWLLQDTIF